MYLPVAVLELHRPEAVASAIDEILARDEFHPRENPLVRLLEWLFDKLGIENPAVADDLGALIMWGMVAMAVAALLYLIFVAARGLAAQPLRRDANSGSKEEVLARRLHSLWADAEAAKAQGDLVLALRLYFFALVVGLGEKGDLEYRDAWTNRELLERGEPDRRVDRMLRPWLARLDAVSFGGMTPRVEDVNEMAELSRGLLGKVVQ